MPQTSTSVSMHAPFGAAGSLRNLARRDADGGKYPQAPLIDVGGILYGTTNNGGAFRGRKTCHGGCGTVFSITTSGVVKVLHSFGNSQDGQYPAEAGLVDVGGTLYGTTSAGGALGGGTVFSITTDGVENVLHSFGAQGDGVEPIG
ncbi:MAG: choice-of-anchor tandem repeat GloVer-containing protein, partial [Candidatus Cybelea sp.]